MKIIEEQYHWSGVFGERTRTEYIIIHHRAGSGDAQSLHRLHLEGGWSGIGYHFYIRQNGKIYRGRPLNAIGAHCLGKNCVSVGVCFEGNYQNEREMPIEQLNSGRKLISFLKKTYPCAQISKHEDFFTTLCPGKNFPFSEIKDAAEDLELPNDIIWELMHGKHKVEINEVDKAVLALEKAKQEDSSLYWILKKIANG